MPPRDEMPERDIEPEEDIKPNENETRQVIARSRGNALPDHSGTDVQQPRRDATPPRKPETSPLRFAGAGIELAGTTLLFAGLGYWIDTRAGGAPSLGVALGALIGFALGMYRLIRLALKP